MTLAEALVAHCRADSLTIATAESLTAGLLAATIADVPGCSAVLRGGVVAYATDVKIDLLGVDAQACEHVVSQAVAEQLAAQACLRLDADLGIGTTGVAGPDPLDGQAPGTAWIALHERATARTTARLVQVEGDRNEIRTKVVQAALALALERWA